MAAVREPVTDHDPTGSAESGVHDQTDDRANVPALAAPPNPQGSPAEPASAPSRGLPAPLAPAVVPRSTARTLELLDDLRKQVAGCEKCGLCQTRQQTVFARGSGSSGLCFVGEGPGADEDARGEPFVGKAGQLLDRMIEAMGFARDEVYVCNVIKCRPPKNRKPTPEEMGTCAPYLHAQLELVDPQVIVALGATAVEGLLGKSGGITRIRGEFRLYRGEIAVMPTFHPAYLLRNPGAKRDVWHDLRKVVRHMGRELPS